MFASGGVQHRSGGMRHGNERERERRLAALNVSSYDSSQAWDHHLPLFGIPSPFFHFHFLFLLSWFYIKKY